MEISTIQINKPKKRKIVEEDEAATLAISTLKIEASGCFTNEEVFEEEINFNPRKVPLSSREILFEDVDEDVDEEFTTVTIQIPPIDQYIHLLMETPEVWNLECSVFALIADYKIREGKMKG